jgi:hypothetical protein
MHVRNLEFRATRGLRERRSKARTGRTHGVLRSEAIRNEERSYKGSWQVESVDEAAPSERGVERPLGVGDVDDDGRVEAERIAVAVSIAEMKSKKSQRRQQEGSE